MAIDECTKTTNNEGMCSHNTTRGCHICTELTEIGQQISAARMAFKSLLDKERSLKNESNQHHDPFIHRFPSEIASKIFSFCVLPIPTIDEFEMVVRMEGTPLAESYHPQRQLGGVCKLWRQIVLSTPELWQVLYLRLTEKLKDPYSIYKMLQAWITRSGQTLLFISISCYNSRGSSSETTLDWVYLNANRNRMLGRVMRVLGQCVSRCKMLHLALPYDLMSMLKISSSVVAPMEGLYIEFLPELSSTGFSQETPYDGSFKLSNSIPRTRRRLNSSESERTVECLTFSIPHLLRLSIKSFRLRNVFDIDWTSITHLTCGRLSDRECIEVLKRTSRLVNCTFEDIRSPSATDSTQATVDDPIVPVHHTSLCTLRISECHSLQFCTYMTFPNLLHLDLSTLEVVYEEDWDNLTAFIRHPGQQLKTLQIQPMSIPGQENRLLEFLELVPSLQRLRLIDDLHEDVLVRLAKTAGVNLLHPDGSVDTNQRLFLPDLQQLILEGVQSLPWWSLRASTNTIYRPLHEVVIKLSNELNYEEILDHISCIKGLYFEDVEFQSSLKEYIIKTSIQHQEQLAVEQVDSVEDD